MIAVRWAIYVPLLVIVTVITLLAMLIGWAFTQLDL